MANIEYKINLENSWVTPDEIEAFLPNWKTKVVEIYEFKNSPKKYEIKILIKAKTIEEIEQWLEAYKEKTKCSYSITSNKPYNGQLVKFKQRLHCHHNTGASRVYDVSERNRTRNVNCPSTICITLRAVHKRYQGKDKSKAPDPEMPTEIMLCPVHNHNTETLDALSFRAVSKETRNKLVKLFQNGHSPGTALETLKMDIYLHEDEYEIKLADRKYCPDYMYCYHLYKKELLGKYRPVQTSTERLESMVEKFNDENENCAAIEFHGNDYVMCICPPLFKRVHENVDAAGEIVFMDSTDPVDHDGSRVFILLTNSNCGGVPLGIIVTSYESTNLITNGFYLLKKIVGRGIFRSNSEGPKLFLIGDSAAEQAAVNLAWQESTCLLSTYHVLQSIWRWLIKPKNGIPKNYQHTLFEDFRSVLYAKTSEIKLIYEHILRNAEQYPKYHTFLENYWEQRELWALCYRDEFSRDTDNFLEAAIRLLKDNIFERTKAFNLTQLVDFMCTKFVSYYEKRILDGAHNRLQQNILGDHIEKPSPEILNKITPITDSIHMVPSENVQNSFCIVNSEILMCTCDQGRRGRTCKHVLWVCCFIKSDRFIQQINSMDIRQKLYFIATGHNPPKNLLLPIDLICDNILMPEAYSSDDDLSSPETSSVTKDISIRINENDLTKEIKKEYLSDDDLSSPDPLSITEDISIREKKDLIRKGKSKLKRIKRVYSSDSDLVSPEPSSVTENISIRKNKEDLIEKGKTKLKQMFDTFSEFLFRSPLEVNTGLDSIISQLDEIKTVSEFKSACNNFKSSEKLPLKNRNVIPVLHSFAVGRKRNSGSKKSCSKSPLKKKKSNEV